MSGGFIVEPSDIDRLNYRYSPFRSTSGIPPAELRQSTVEGVAHRCNSVSPWRRALRYSHFMEVDAPMLIDEGNDRQIIRDRLARLTNVVETMLSKLALHNTPKAVHDLRIAVRRLRAAFWNLKRELPRRERRRCMSALLEMADACNTVRDADVRQHLVRTWLGRAGLEDREQGHQLLAIARRSAETARHELRWRMNTRSWSDLLWTVKQNAAALAAVEGPSDDILLDVLSDQQRRLRHRLRKDIQTNHLRRLHRLRLRIKDVRYFSEDFGPFVGKPTEGELAQLRELQRALGDLHDEWGLRKWLRKQYKCYLATGAMLDLLKKHKRKLLNEIRQLGRACWRRRQAA
jgi:CHAD domain-containing protein